MNQFKFPARNRRASAQKSNHIFANKFVENLFTALEIFLINKTIFQAFILNEKYLFNIILNISFEMTRSKSSACSCIAPATDQLTLAREKYLIEFSLEKKKSCDFHVHEKTLCDFTWLANTFVNLNPHLK